MKTTAPWIGIFALVATSAYGAAPTITIVSGKALLEPSTCCSANDKDGYPPGSGNSSGDPEEGVMAAKIVNTSPITAPQLVITRANGDTTQDLQIDERGAALNATSAARDLTYLCPTGTNVLPAGTWYVYWNIQKKDYDTNLPS